jgi:phosphoribosylpyrophosphate synthetase
VKHHGRISAREGYSGSVHRAPNLREHATYVAHVLEKRRNDYDFVACTGQSGMSVAFAALMLYEFPLVVVRKGERTHGNMIEGDAERIGRYIVVDDFISSGATMRRINRELRKWADDHDYAAPTHVGSVLYVRKRFDKSTYNVPAHDDPEATC